MNRTSHTDEPYEGDGEGFNQSPRSLAADLTTNEDLNGNVNTRTRRRSEDDDDDDDRANGRAPPDAAPVATPLSGAPEPHPRRTRLGRLGHLIGKPSKSATHSSLAVDHSVQAVTPGGPSDQAPGRPSFGHRVKDLLFKFGSFIGPGFMISVAYIDPGNYSTGVAAGATYQFRLLFVVLLANLFAIFLQTLCIKLGTATGLNLAQACRAFLPRWMNYVLYFFAEVAIIATDIAEVIGFAIGLNLLVPAIPLVAGCAISILDVMLILLFYQPHGSMKGLRLFEMLVAALVLAVVICFCIQLSLIKDTPIGHVFRGYIPSSAIIQQQGLYQACGILGATVMPHSLYLGSGIVQPRLLEFDTKHGLLPEEVVDPDDDDIDKGHYVPSMRAIRHCYSASSLELALSLFTFALFVNSAIVIVAGSSLYNNHKAPDADIFAIHKLLSQSISKGAGTVFALALLLSGISAGIVCTISGQMVCEGAINWKLRPWLRRLITRSISIIPSVVIAASVGQKGLNDALNGSQVVLSIVLPFVTAPLIYFTCVDKYMTVSSGVEAPRMTSNSPDDQNVHQEESEEQRSGHDQYKMTNTWYTACIAALLWLAITSLNIGNLVLLGLGKG